MHLREQVSYLMMDVPHYHQFMFLAPVRAWGVLILRLSFRIITNQQKIPLRPWRLCGSTIKSEGNNVGAADKAAIQLVEVQPYQLLVSDT